MSDIHSPTQETNGSPTVGFYAQLQLAFDHFNEHLFESKLPPCLITLRSSSRHYGYHHKDRFINLRGTMIDELGLHPGFFTLRPVDEVLSTLVHEMVHHWQDTYGQPSRSNPHNRQWASKMREIGLEPTSTGLPGGKDTGQTVSHFIKPDGPFITACRLLLKKGFELPWFDRHLPRVILPTEERQVALKEAGVAVAVSTPLIAQLPEAVDGKQTVISPPPKQVVDRVRYTCAGCGVRAWAKSGVRIICGECATVLDSCIVDRQM